jgi:pyruvate carboxylase
MVLPNKEYIPGIVPQESLRNMQLVDWEGIARTIGMPCILKDAHGGGWRDVYVCHSLEELITNYDQSGLLTMIVQEFIHFEQFVRCMCLGQEEILVMQYDPKQRRYIVDQDYLPAALRERVVRDCLTIVRALGYDMNSIEFAIRDGIPYAIDFMNPAPDMDIYSLTQPYFDWVVTHMADMVIRLAKGGRRQVVESGWAGLFASSRKG